MAISRSQMRRQLSNRGGITNLSPRQNFGLGSKLKRFVRKVIPNEVSKVATVAAPFVAPFNPALAGAMAGIGSFDQTGSISDALKRGALTYGGGQAARYIGGAGFQGNPFAQGGAFTSSGFTSGFSSPLGTQTGLGKFFEQRRVANIGKDLKEIGEVQGLTGSDVGGNITMAESAGGNIVDEVALNVTGNTKDTVKSNVFKQMLENPSIENIGNAAVEGAKKLGKAIFYDKDGNLDKNVLLGTIAFTASYAEGKALANDVGVELTEAEYDEATKAEKKAEYAANLQNFYAGKNEGGRIGFDNGGIDMIALEKSVIDNPEMVNEITDIEFGVAEPSEPTDMGSFIKFDKEKEESEMLEELLRELQADGGRTGFFAGTIVKEGIKQVGKIIFSPAEKTFLFKTLGKLGGADRSSTFPNLFKILKDPSKFPKDAKALKEFINLRMKKAKGGIMDIPVRRNEAGVQELDMRSSGGFIPIGVKEKADDVPAMLSKNEFVLTADAVRGIGGGSVEKGSEKLYNLMKTAEQVGKA